MFNLIFITYLETEKSFVSEIEDKLRILLKNRVPLIYTVKRVTMESQDNKKNRFRQFSVLLGTVLWNIFSRNHEFFRLRHVLFSQVLL